MRYLALCLFLCATHSLSLQAQNYYDLDFSNISFEDQALPYNISYTSYYQAEEQDFIVANQSTSDIIQDHFLFFGANLVSKAAKRNYVSVEVCYDVFPYKPTRLTTPPFNVPLEKSPSTKLSKLPLDTQPTQVRIAKPIKTQPGKFEVIYDLTPPTTRTEGYQCFTLNFPRPYILPIGARVSVRTIIGAEKVIRFDRVRLISR